MNVVCIIMFFDPEEKKQRWILGSHRLGWAKLMPNSQACQSREISESSQSEPIDYGKKSELQWAIPLCESQLAKM
jgi:hypothetical protein